MGIHESTKVPRRTELQENPELQESAELKTEFICKPSTILDHLRPHPKEVRIIISRDKVFTTLKHLIDATGNFSDRNIIGSGVLGIAYKAQVQGQTVIVKRFPNCSEIINKLENAVSTISVLEHNNLIQVLDAHIGKRKQFLVYEYMRNGSLADALFDSNSRLKLTWETRFNICLGIAKGLEYLHEHPRLKLVHGNIKATNVLLDHNLEAKISDFGLDILCTQEDQIMFIKSTAQAHRGYMAPEYVVGTITSKADVYSFGVLLLEIVSGKKNIMSKSNQELVLLLDWAYALHSKRRLFDLVDERLFSKYDEKQVLTILILAIKCASISPSHRPTMSKVVRVLLGDEDLQE